MPQDSEVSAVAIGLKEAGHKCDILYPLDLSNGARWSWNPSDSILCVDHACQQQVFDMKNYDSTWMRRPPSIIPQEGISDPIERSTAENEFSILAKSIYEVLANRSFCVNPYSATQTASNKGYQLAVAADIGLPVLDTIISNSRDEIMSFYGKHSERVIYKALKSGVWAVDTVGYARSPSVPTTVMTKELLDQADLSASPGIYQPLIDKQMEARITIMGRTLFGWSKSFERDDLDIDWRYMHRDAKISRYDVEEQLANKIFALMDRLELVFGCIDLIIDRNGCVHFLEINPQGQFLWGERYGVGLNLLDGMCQFLTKGDPQFRFTNPVGLSLDDLQANEIMCFHREEAERHHGHVGRSYFHQISIAAYPEVKEADPSKLAAP